jgi:hypothetical protein
MLTISERAPAKSTCEGVGTLSSSIIPKCQEETKEDGIGRNEDDETISRMS